MLMDRNARYLTADENFICKLLATGLFSIKPFYGNARSDRCIVEIDFIDNRVSDDLESKRHREFVRLCHLEKRL